MKFKHAANYLLLLVLLVSCVPCLQPLPTDDWVYADLRNLDPVDTLHPSQDLIAVYIRSTGKDFQIRLDLLDQALLPNFDLYITLDTMPGGRRDIPIEVTTDLEWDLLLIVPASGDLMVMDHNYHKFSGTEMFAMRDFLGDTLILTLNKVGLSIPGYLSASNPAFRLQVFLTPIGSKELLDRSVPVSTVSSPPPPASVLFAFWNTYPAYSPVTALRRWNGAHTGPLGGNHGLFPLLHAAQNAGIPLVLLDLKNPASLSALDISGNLNLVKEMVSQGGLILPDYLPDVFPDQNPLWNSFSDQILALNRIISRRFKMPDSPFATTPQGLISIQPRTQILFSRIIPKPTQTSSLKSINIIRWRDRRIIPIEMGYDHSMQATSEGPALDVRQSLIETALAANQTSSPASLPILILGGDLSTSTWGVGPMARETFRYLKGHPWVHILTTYELLASIPESDGEEIQEAVLSPNETSSNYEPLSSTPFQPVISIASNSKLLEAIRQCPQEKKKQNAEVINPLCEAALQAYLSLFNPVSLTSDKLPILRANYVGQVWALLEAAFWGDSPYRRSSCDTDPDRDGQLECVMASESLYTQFEIKSGSLSYAFYRHLGDNQIEEIHQLIGPSSQFITGLSDPGTWDLRGGLSADPAVITGGFVENELNYQVRLDSDKLIFTSSSGHVVKTYQLTPDGVHVEYTLSPDLLLSNPRIPLTLDPWRRFYPDWAEHYQPITISNGWAWQIKEGLLVKIQTDASITEYTFKDSLTSFSEPEDPNYDYPPGHFLPFPIILIEINSQGRSSVDIDIILYSK